MSKRCFRTFSSTKNDTVLVTPNGLVFSLCRHAGRDAAVVSVQFFTGAPTIEKNNMKNAEHLRAGHGEISPPHVWSTCQPNDQPTTCRSTWTWCLFKENYLQEIYADGPVVGWSAAGRHVDRPSVGQISPWPARKVTEQSLPKPPDARPPKSLGKVWKNSREVPGPPAPGDFFQKCSGFRAQRAWETPSNGQRVHAKITRNLPHMDFGLKRVGGGLSRRRNCNRRAVAATAVHFCQHIAWFTNTSPRSALVFLDRCMHNPEPLDFHANSTLTSKQGNSEMYCKADTKHITAYWRFLFQQTHSKDAQTYNRINDMCLAIL